jgi:hypothetical protein
VEVGSGAGVELGDVADALGDDVAAVSPALGETSVGGIVEGSMVAEGLEEGLGVVPLEEGLGLAVPPFEMSIEIRRWGDAEKGTPA